MSVVYPHYAHLNKLLVAPGKKVKRGDIIGFVGKTGNAGTAHLHFEGRKNLFGGVNYYPYGRSKRWIRENYYEPLALFTTSGFITPMDFDRFGYRYLQWTGRVFHPGEDLNKGYGNSDLGLAVRAINSGLIHYAGYDRGWGNHIIQECSFDPRVPVLPRLNEALRKCGDDPHRSVGTLTLSRWWQNRVVRDPGKFTSDEAGYRALVGAIKWHMAEKRYPHNN